MSRKNTPAPGSQPLASSPPPRRSPFFQRMRNYLLAGVLVAAPLAITAWLTITIVGFFDDFARSWFPGVGSLDQVLPFAVPGLGMIIVLVSLIFIGFMTANLVGRLLVGYMDKLLARVPVISSVYRTIKQIFDTVLANRSTAFRQVVLVEYPRKGIWAIAFVTSDLPEELEDVAGGEEFVSVFLPTTPNPTSGFLLYLPRKDVRPVDISVEEGVRLVVSSGIVKPGSEAGKQQGEPQT